MESAQRPGPASPTRGTGLGAISRVFGQHGRRSAKIRARPGCPESALREMTAAGVGGPEQEREPRLSAVQVFLVAAALPTAEDTRERRAKDALTGYGVTKPIFDAASGVRLDPRKVANARGEEIDEVRKHKVYVKVPRSQAVARRKRVIGTKWLDINKGDAVAPEYRSRLVAKELRAFAPWVP